MVGGNGTDVVTYASATQAITANLNTGIATGEGEDSIGLVENLIGSGYDDVLTGSTGANSIWGGNGLDTIDGGDGLDRLYGEDGSDTLYGGVGSDILDGGAGDDFIYGGIGNDTLTGGSGADRFVFLAESFTTPLQTDTILDFNVSDGDVLDMSAIDANASIAGDQAFSRVGSFTGVAGQATVVFANNQTIIRFDLNGDRATDFQIRLDGDHTGTALLTGAEAPGTGGWIF
jgi:serralysin